MSQEAPSVADRIVFSDELRELVRVSSETIRRWRKAGKLPTPDVAISQKRTGWRLSTLRDSGIL